MRARLALLTSLCLAVAGRAHADTWTDMWSTHEQQAQKLLDSKHPEAAASLFSDTRRRAYAEMEAGQYAKAAKSLAPFKDADSQYNRGNALAHTGRLKEALTAYDAALAAAPGDKDVIRNRDLVKRALEEQKNQSGQEGGSDGSPGSKGSKGGQSQGGNHSPGGGQPQPGGQSQAGNQPQPGGQSQANNQSQSGQQSQGGGQSQSGSQPGGNPSQSNGPSQANNQGGGNQSQSGGQSQAASQAQGNSQQQGGQSQGTQPQQANQAQARNQSSSQSSQAGGQSQAANQAQGGNPSQAANPSQSAAPSQAGATRPGDNTAGEGSLAPNGQQTNGATAAGGLNAENAQQDANAALRYRQSQQAKSGSETNPRGTASVLSPDGKASSSADVPAPKPPSEQSLALDQWLRGIPDDSAELLRRKFLIEHMLKQQRNEP